MTQSLDSWVVAAVATAILAVLGFLVRNAFDGVTKGLVELGAKMDALKDAAARSDTRTAVLESRLLHVERVAERLEREMKELSEGRP